MNFDVMTNMYSITKMLRFELKPTSTTQKNIEKYKIIEKDSQYVEKYKIVKSYMDDYHREYIKKSLKDVKLDFEELHQAYREFKKNKNKDNRDKYQKIQKKYLKEIRACFLPDSEKFNSLFGKKMITKNLLEVSDKYNEEDIKIFDKFTSYFKVYFENRKNIYSDDIDMTGSVPYRIIADNFEIFSNNISQYLHISTDCPEIAEKVKINFDIDDLEKVFSVNNYNNCILQEGIENFNKIITGYSLENGSKIQGINEIVNEYCQKNKKEKKKYIMLPLKKQILSKTNTYSYIPEIFEKPEEVMYALNRFWDEIKNKKVLEKIKQLIKSYKEYDKGLIYIKSKDWPKISIKLGKNWDYIEDCLEKYLNIKLKYKEKKTKEFMEKKYHSVDIIEEALKENNESILFINYFDYVYQEVCDIEKFYIEYQNVFLNDNFIKDDESVKVIKIFLDQLLDLNQFIKIFYSSGREECDYSFYSQLEEVKEYICGIVSLYNKTRNFVTKKDYSVDKIKLNFENPVLASGWDRHKVNSYNTCILRDDNVYYLCILNAKKKPKIEKIKKDVSHNFDRIVINFFPDVSNMIPKCSVAMQEVKKHFETFNEEYNIDNKKYVRTLTVTKEIFELYDITYNGKKKFQIDYLRQNPNDEIGYKNALFTWIDFCKDFCKSYESTSQFELSDVKETKEYDRLDEFYADLNKCMYNVKFEKVSKAEIYSLEKNEEIFLFKIYNKDFSANKKSKGRDNLHTMYFKELFSEKNFKDIVFKLNGNAELFFREKSIKKPLIHKKGSVLVGKKISDNKGNIVEYIEPDIYEEIYKYRNGIIDEESLSKKSKEYIDEGLLNCRTAEYDIVKDKRYTEDKYLFYVSIAINQKLSSKINISGKVTEQIKSGENIRVIGIDRGERNLLYVSLINENGDIIKQKNYNIIDRQNYKQKIEAVENQRTEARRSWKNIVNIKELKEGYLSLVIHEICDMAIENNAIIVMEDLNFGFKRGRFKFEKQIYQKFEKMLIKKLNYFVYKDREKDMPGGVLNGYQLTNELTTLDKIGKQCGIIFYVPAAYTSKIDPVSGFIDNFRFDSLTDMEKKRKFLSKFESVKYENDSDTFRFAFDYNNFDVKIKDMYISKWVVNTYGKRIVYNAGEKKYEDKFITENLKEIFKSRGIDYENGDELLPFITNMTCEKRNASFWDGLLRNFQYTIQMRNSRRDTEEDYIISPIKNGNGGFYMSNGDDEDTRYPSNADANGAYHIALKGLMLCEKIKDIEKNKDKKNKDEKNSTKEWLDYAQRRNIRE